MSTDTQNAPANNIVPERSQPMRLTASSFAISGRTPSVITDSGPNANLLDTSRFEHLLRLAKVMAYSSLLPDHLVYVKGKAANGELPIEQIEANCFRIINQALRWGFDPFAIIDSTYLVSGKLGYEGKLVAAVINTRAELEGRLSYVFNGNGDNLTVTVRGKFPGEPEPRTVDLRLGDAKTENQMWRKDPQQKLIYSGVVKWARRHCPEVVMGVLTDDDLERIAESREPDRIVQNLNESKTATLTAQLAERRAAKQPETVEKEREPEKPKAPAQTREELAEIITNGKTQQERSEARRKIKELDKAGEVVEAEAPQTEYDETEADLKRPISMETFKKSIAAAQMEEDLNNAGLLAVRQHGYRNLTDLQFESVKRLIDAKRAELLQG